MTEPAEAVHRVPDDADGNRLDVVLADLLGISRSQAAASIEAGRVRIDGATVDKAHRVHGGEDVSIAPEPAPAEVEKVVPPPPVRYEDEHLLVVAKRAGTVVHPGAGNPTGTLVQALEAAGVPLAPAGGDVRPGIVHRLDRDTSGLLAVAKTDDAHRGLVAALKRREVHRSYLVLAEGSLPGRTGRVEAPVGRDPADRKRFAAVAEGKPAVTRWEVLAEARVRTTEARPTPLTYLRCRLETGRTHQIRVHLAYAGHPVVADVTYGARADVAAALGLDRMFLHAAELAFVHPVTGVEVDVREPLPEDLRSALSAAGIDPDQAS